jgi:beta-phosphoglucomutase-like phosphatase (HAD superfamily)
VILSLQSTKQEVLRSKEKAIALMSKLLNVEKDVAEDTYNAYKETVAGNGVPTREGMEQILNALRLAGRFKDRKVAFEEIADDRIAKQVAKQLGYETN